MVAAAEVETSRLLRDVPVAMDWLNCAPPGICSEPERPSELTVRIVEKAMPSATSSALGTAAWSEKEGGAFIFYDQAMALRTHSRPLMHILGRVMAHEIMHLLLPEDEHTDMGLMRGLWYVDDFRFDSQACSQLACAAAK